jgi:hypothetical protein
MVRYRAVVLVGTPSTRRIESSKTSNVVDVLSSSLMSKVNSRCLFIVVGVLITALETNKETRRPVSCTFFGF